MTEEFISVSDLRKVTATRLRESKSVMVIVSKAQPRAVIIPYGMFMAVQELRKRIEATP
jgi:hypothetical protein